MVTVELAHQRLQLAGGLGYVDADDLRPVAVQHPRESRSPMPRLAPVTRAILPFERTGSSGRPASACFLLVGADAHDLAGDVGRLGGEEEGQRPRRWRRPHPGLRRPAGRCRPCRSPCRGERVKPSRARWAISLGALGRTRAWCRGRRCGGRVSRLRSSGVKNSCWRAIRPLGAGDTRWRRRRAPCTSRRRWWMASTRRRGSRGRSGSDPAQAAVGHRGATVPSTSGAPSAYRSRRRGAGEAEVLHQQLADGAREAKPW